VSSTASRRQQGVGNLRAGDVAVVGDEAVGLQVVELARGEGVDAVPAEQLARNRLGGDAGQRAVAADAAEQVVRVAKIACVLARQAGCDRVGDADRGRCGCG
jgi:hypothetical protein